MKNKLITFVNLVIMKKTKTKSFLTELLERPEDFRFTGEMVTDQKMIIEIERK